MSEKNTFDETPKETLNNDDIELSAELNPDIYFKDKSEDLKDNEFVTMKSEGAVSGFFDWIRCILFAISIVVICLTFVFRLVDVDGTSMESTLESKDKVIVTNLFYTPKDGDIIVISHGAEYAKPIIKRVIATEGQTIKLDYENDRIIVDGVVLEESYISDSAFAGNYGDYEIPEVVPEGKVFVMGDNRRVSLDSRRTEIGLIDVDNVIGKAQFVAFPFSDFGYLY
ncbi:signal peptidase I [Ruminococcus sp.]|uniref:signal peptidase I n=1 Tax=Ruminococcus sp. TaxID=41978 RepID=UPI003F07ED6B